MGLAARRLRDPRPGRLGAGRLPSALDLCLLRRAARRCPVLVRGPCRARTRPRTGAPGRRSARAPFDRRAACRARWRREAEAVPDRRRVAARARHRSRAAWLEAVLAHELAHVRNRDVVVQTSVVVLAATLLELSRVGGWFQRVLLWFLGPLASAFVHLLLSPKREFLADRAAAAICDTPHPMADALVRLDQAAELVSFSGSPATEPLYTINPFLEVGLAALFVTHPPVGERVRRLRELDPDWREKLRAA